MDWTSAHYTSRNGSGRGAPSFSHATGQAGSSRTSNAPPPPQFPDAANTALETIGNPVFPTVSTSYASLAPHQLYHPLHRQLPPAPIFFPAATSTAVHPNPVFENYHMYGHSIPSSFYPTNAQGTLSHQLENSFAGNRDHVHPIGQHSTLPSLAPPTTFWSGTVPHYPNPDISMHANLQPQSHVPDQVGRNNALSGRTPSCSALRARRTYLAQPRSKQVHTVKNRRNPAQVGHSLPHQVRQKHKGYSDPEASAQAAKLDVDSSAKSSTIRCTATAGIFELEAARREAQRLGSSIPGDSPVELEKWIKERKAKWPSRANVERKLQEEAARNARGEIPLKPPGPTLRDRVSGKSNVENISKRRKIANGPGVVQADVQPKIKSPISVPNAVDVVSDRSKVKAPGTGYSANGLQDLAAHYAEIHSSDDDQTELEEGQVVDSPEIPSESRSRCLPEGSARHPPRRRQRKRSSRRGTGNNILDQPKENKSRPSLLRRLLEPEIREEQSIVLQCIRFIVNENFFETQSIAGVVDESMAAESSLN